MALVYRYTGDPSVSEHFVDIPARDLDESDFAALTDAQRALVTNGRLYRAVTHPKPPEEDAPKDAPAKDAPKVAAKK